MAGARETSGVIAGLQSRGRNIIASLPEPARGSGAFDVPTRTGAFDSVDAFAGWLSEIKASKVIDVSHAFEDDVSCMAYQGCIAKNVPYLRLIRRPWLATFRDRWLHASSVGDAVAAIPPKARVFSNTGWNSLPDYADFKGEKVFLRQTHPVLDPPIFPFVEFVEGRPPFSQDQEEQLFRHLRITHLICRNVGGAASMSKILAARRLMIPVYMVDRQPPPKGASVVQSVAEALAWEANT